MLAGGIRGAAPAGLVRRAYGWWRRELAAALPQSWRIEPRLERRVLVRAGDPLIVYGVDAERSESTSFLTFDRLDADGIEQLRTHVGDAETAVSLDPRLVHRLHLSLPYEARSQLRKAVGYQLQAAAPVDPEQLLYSVRLTERPARGLPLQVEVVLARKADVAALAERWRSAIGPAAIGWADAASNRLTAVFDAASRPRRLSRIRSPAFYLAGLFAGLLTCAPVALAAVLGIADGNLRRETALARQDLAPRLKAAVDARQLAAIERVLAEPLARPRVAALIEALARSLPPGAWVERIQWSNGQARVTLVGADATAIDKLRADPLFARLTAAAPSTGSRTEIVVDLGARPDKA